MANDRQSKSSRSDGPVRVTHVVHDFEGGGLETLVASMMRNVDTRRVTPSVVSLSGRVGRLGQEMKQEGFGALAVKPAPLVSMVAPLSLSRALRQLRTEVAHIHSGVWFKATVAARLAGVRGIVFTEHGREHHDPATVQWLDRQASRSTDAVVAVSRRLESYMRDTIGVASHRLLTIENGVDTDRFAPNAPSATTRAAFDIPQSALVVGSVGRLEAVKAYDRLLRAVATVRAGGDIDRPVYVLLCGDGSQRGALEAQARSLGIADVVRFPGWLGDPADAYRMMDVFVLPSISEGLSVSLLEAMSTGVVPLVTPVGANRDVLGEQLGGQIVDGDDAPRFAAVLAETLKSDARRRELANAAREIVIARFSQARMLGEYASLYERLARR